MAKKSTAVVVTAPDSLREIVALAHQQLTIQRDIEELETRLKRLNAILLTLSTESLPAAMAEAQLKEFTLDTGETIQVKEDFIVGIPAPRREEAYNWLEEHGFGGLIKTEITIAFGKGELERAQKLLLALSKKKLPAELSRNVMWQTLKAFISEQVREAKPVPLDLFGAIPMNKAIIKAPKLKG